MNIQLLMCANLVLDVYSPCPSKLRNELNRLVEELAALTEDEQWRDRFDVHIKELEHEIAAL